MTMPKPEDILQFIMPRLWKSHKHAQELLSLEIIAGPWKGVVFYYKSFEVMNQTDEQGMAPAKFETHILHRPASLKDWTPDEKFDIFTTHVLFSWLSIMQQQTLGLLHTIPTSDKVH
jgi:hypothetical protein